MIVPPLGRILFRDRLVIVGLLLLVVATTWLYTIEMARMMVAIASSSHSHMIHDILSPHQEHFGVLALAGMWVVMMVAMMLPSVIPVTVMHARHLRGNEANPQAHSLVFALGYTTVWIAFSIVASVLQLGLERYALISPTWMRLEHEQVGAAVLIAAGLYQFSPMKNACLRQCRTPLGFLMTEWRDGLCGAWTMGILNGLYCVGCCWALMLLLFVGGVMNMLWMFGLTLIMLVEKVAPGGQYFARVIGIFIVLAGISKLGGLFG